MNEYGILVNTKYEVDSRFVADLFEKDHKNVMQAINGILEHSGFSSEFRRLNFKPTSYMDSQNKKRPCYLMTRDGFTAQTFDVGFVIAVPDYQQRKQALKWKQSNNDEKV